MAVAILAEPLPYPSESVAESLSSGSGAVVTFLGVVRDAPRSVPSGALESLIALR